MRYRNSFTLDEFFRQFVALFLCEFFFFFFLFFSLYFNCNELGVDKVTRSLTSIWWYAFYLFSPLLVWLPRIEYSLMYGKTLSAEFFFAISKLLFPQSNAHTHTNRHRPDSCGWYISVAESICSTIFIQWIREWAQVSCANIKAMRTPHRHLE